MAGAIIKGEEHFFTTLFEGNGGGQRVGNFVPFTDNGTIANSCLFNRADNATMTRTPSSAGTRTKFTISVWVKLSSNFGTRRFIFYAAASGNNFAGIEISSNNRFRMYASDGVGASVDLDLESTRTLEDTSKWYHLVAVFDSTQSSASDRAKMYIDGDQVTVFSTNTNNLVEDFEFQGTNNVLNIVGGWDSSVGGSPATYAFDGYMAEMNLVDGTAYTPSTFGLTDTSTGRWIPKTLTGISYGTNGFRLQHGTNSNLGDDTSGNSQDFTSNNLATTDQTTDSPTQNHMTFDPLRSSDWTFTEGNLQCAGTPSSGAGRHSLSNMILPKSGKYYFEMTVDVNNDSPRYFGLAKADASVTEGTTANVLPRVVVIRNGGTSDGHFISDGSTASANGFATTNGTVINFALDATNEKLYVGKDGSYYDFEGGSGNPTNGTGATFTNIYKTIDWKAINMSFSTGSGGTSHKVTWNFGQKTFAHTAPTGFSALQQDNFPETSKGTPGFTWIKDRDNSLNHNSYDSSNGVFNRLVPNENSAILNTQGGVSKFLKGGIAVGDTANVNNNNASMVAWNWVANGGTTSANTDGSGATIASTIQANQTAGFSIVRYDGDGGNAARKVAHGLSQAPEWILLKFLDVTGNWTVYHKSIGNTGRLSLNLSSGTDTSSNYFNNTSPTSSVFTVGSSFNQSTAYDYVAYCWHSVPGFSKIGKYVGNQNADGPFVYTGFKPAWVITKSSSTATNWNILDTTRSPVNPMTLRISAVDADAEESNRSFDFLSNGFKLRESGTDVNQSGITYVYAAFAKHPFNGDGETAFATAR